VHLCLCSRSPEAYADQPDDREPGDPSGKKLDKEMKQGSGKAEMSEPLSQYDINSYPSASLLSVTLFVRHKHLK